MLLSVMAGHDQRDSTSVDAPVPDYAKQLCNDISGKRIGVSEAFLAGGLDPAVRDAVQAAVALFEREGARIVPVELPHIKYAVAVYYLIAPAEASSNLARFDGVHYGFRSDRPRNMADLYASSRGQVMAR